MSRVADVERKTVLVTGGAGFAGSYVVRELFDHGYQPVPVDIADFRPETRFIVARDVSVERAAVDNWPEVVDVVSRISPRAIVHLASIMDVDLLDRSPMLAYSINLGGTMNVLEAARLFGVERVVIFSTVAVHGQLIYQPLDGNHPTVTARKGPLGAYSAGKLAGEAFAYTYQQAFDLDVRIIRPSALYGFGMSWFAPNYIKQIVEPAVMGEEVHLASGGSVPRDYANVSDVAGLTRALIEAPKDADRIFYAATGRELQTGGDVARIVRTLIPGSVVEIADEWTEDDRAELAFRGEISVENAKRQLGWEPRFPDLSDGIADYILRLRSFIEHGGTVAPKPATLRAPGAA